MPLTSLSLTGWDNTVDVAAAVDFIAAHPESTLGIHFSQERRGERRHPNKNWVRDFTRLLRGQPFDVLQHVKLDAHLGNRWSLEAASGNFAVLDDEVDPALFKRVQLNHLGRARPAQFLEAAAERPQFMFIIARSGPTLDFCQGLDDLLPNYTGPAKIGFLYDDSWGRGLVPTKWPEVLPHAACGYAGGLNQDNLADQLTKLAELNPYAEYWADMETGLRNQNDFFDLEKAAACAAIARQFI